MEYNQSGQRTREAKLYLYNRGKKIGVCVWDCPAGRDECRLYPREAGDEWGYHIHSETADVSVQILAVFTHMVGIGGILTSLQPPYNAGKDGRLFHGLTVSFYNLLKHSRFLRTVCVWLSRLTVALQSQPDITILQLKKRLETFGDRHAEHWELYRTSNSEFNFMGSDLLREIW